MIYFSVFFIIVIVFVWGGVFFSGGCRICAHRQEVSWCRVRPDRDNILTSTWHWETKHVRGSNFVISLFAVVVEYCICYCRECDPCAIIRKLNWRHVRHIRYFFQLYFTVKCVKERGRQTGRERDRQSNRQGEEARDRYRQTQTDRQRHTQIEQIYEWITKGP